jgi:hypothetical protein
MSKAIFIVGLPEYTEQKAHEDISRILEDKMPDYHVLTYMHVGSELKFQVFNIHDAETIDIQELKAFIIKQINHE